MDDDEVEVELACAVGVCVEGVEVGSCADRDAGVSPGRDGEAAGVTDGEREEEDDEEEALASSFRFLAASRAFLSSSSTFHEIERTYHVTRP